MEWSHVGALIGLVILANGSMVWAVKLLVKRNIEALNDDLNGIRSKIQLHETQQKTLEREVSAIRECMPREYVRREDWIISFARIEQKIDAIWRFIHDQIGGQS